MAGFHFIFSARANPLQVTYLWSRASFAASSHILLPQIKVCLRQLWQVEIMAVAFTKAQALIHRMFAES